MSEELETVETTAESVEDTPEVTSEATTETSDPWANIDFSKEPASDPDGSAAAEPTVPEVEEEVKAEGAETTEAPAEPEASETPEDGSIPTLSRSKLREVEKQIITPFRDPEAPIASVIEGLAKYQPERYRELATTLVTESAKQLPNDWLQAITGIDGLTVEQVKHWHETPPQSTESATTEPVDDAVKFLNEYYGDSWKDPKNDAQIEETDRLMAVLARQALADKEAGVSKTSESEERAARLEKELNDLKPQIEEIKTKQEAEYKFYEESTYKSKVDTYQKEIENRVLPQIIQKNGLEVSDSDTEPVKQVKEMLASSFKPKYDGAVSEFDQYLANAYPNKEGLGKAVQRVDSLISRAAQKEAASEKKANSPQEKAQLKAEADALWEQAVDEQDALTVLYQKAAQEFMKSQTTPMSLLEENAQLRRQLGLNGKRVEITGSASAPGKSLAETLKDSGDKKWDAALDALSQTAR